MEFVNMKLEHVGAGSDAGNVIEQIESELAAIAREVPVEVHEHGWQWRPTACARCAEAGS